MPTAVATELDKILNSDPLAVRNHCQGLYDSLAGKNGGRIVLFGAGFFGRKTLGLLREIGIEPIAFVDNNPKLWGTVVDGLTVISRKDAVEQLGESAAFVVSVFHGTPIREQLIAEGCRTVVPCPYLYWKYPNTFMPYGGISVPEDTLGAAAQVREGMEIWADEASRQVYLTQLEWRMSMDYSVLPPASPTEETYFPPEVLPISNELFVDCGGFDGDSIQAFFESPYGVGARAIAIEPDASNCVALKKRMGVIGKSDRVYVHNVGVASEPGELMFDSTGTAASTLTMSGSSAIRCERLDDLLEGEIPTYLKMDIEGAELDALKGAAATIERCQPVLAICLYHKPEDLWEIPLYVASLKTDYKFYLRAHSEECWELVLYAVPVNRVNSSV